MKSPLNTRVLGALLFAFAMPLMAAVELETRAYREVDAEGTEKKLEVLERAAPGQEVIYVIRYRNSGSEPAENLVVNNPVPTQMRYVAGSAEGTGTTVLVSVDGNNFGELSSLTVTTGDGNSRPAQAQDVTAVRWILNGSLPPGGSGEVRYRAVLK